MMMLAVTSLATASKLCRVVDYGAKTKDSGKKNTEAIMWAASECAAGGTVVIDGGSYTVGPLAFSGKGLFLDIKDASALVTMSGPDEWPVKDGDHETIVHSIDFFTNLFLNCHALLVFVVCTLLRVQRAEVSAACDYLSA
jgi:hypothetical protein